MDTAPMLLAIGYGYSARALALRLMAEGWRVAGTTRDPDRMAAIAADGAGPLRFPLDDPAATFGGASHLLVSAAPGPEGDPVLASHSADIARAAETIRWAGYLSTTGVYGDHGGEWVDEETPPDPGTERGRARAEAEAAWQALAAESGLPLHIFRLAGIYGPGRGPFEKVRSGTARRIVKPGQVFSRIYVEDIAGALAASIARPDPGAIYNLCDDDPAPPEDVIAEAARLLRLPVPPEVPFRDADLSPMARSFYAESKRVSNRRMKEELGYRLKYPDYRSGLAALAAAESRAATRSS